MRKIPHLSDPGPGSEVKFSHCFHMIVTVIISICRRQIGDTSPTVRSYGNQALLLFFLSSGSKI